MTTVSIALVNSAHGIYSAKVLSEQHELYFSTNRIVEESIKVDDDYYTPLKICLEQEFDGFEDETIETFFDPENEFFCENVDFIFNGLCRIKHEGQLWSVQEIEGEYYAIHPKAEWCNDKEEYFIPEVS